MQAAEQSGGVVEAAFYIVRLCAQFLIIIASISACRWGIHTLLLYRGGKSERWRRSFSTVNFILLVLLLVLRMPAEGVLTFLGASIGRLAPASELAWLTPMLEGIYYALIASLILFLAIHLAGLLYWFAEGWIDRWQSQLRARNTAESSPRFQASRIIRVAAHLFCTLLATTLVVAYFLYGFAVFPRTRILTADLLKALSPPLRGAGKAFEDYVPNLGYLFVIFLVGFILLKGLKYFFMSIERGTIVFEDFPSEWGKPTYKLSRTVLVLLLVMVSFPYLPGAHSPFFRGFSLFFGALVTFGSSGIIGNLLAGILLTYQRAFRLGDVVRIEGVFGKITEKTLLITRVVTAGNEHVTIPNSKVLAASVTNYSAHGLSKGFAVGLVATIGYEVDWRTVEELLLDGAARTEQIAPDPAPRVMVNSLGNYSVEYELRSFTSASDEIFATCTALRRNILDAFAEAGVEIMTPTILSHRDASELAVPTERFPNRSALEGIRITMDTK
jgi:small-conductance mechanosensitive channel